MYSCLLFLLNIPNKLRLHIVWYSRFKQVSLLECSSIPGPRLPPGQVSPKYSWRGAEASSSIPTWGTFFFFLSQFPFPSSHSAQVQQGAHQSWKMQLCGLIWFSILTSSCIASLRWLVLGCNNTFELKIVSVTILKGTENLIARTYKHLHQTCKIPPFYFFFTFRRFVTSPEQWNQEDKRFVGTFLTQHL